MLNQEALDHTLITEFDFAIDGLFENAEIVAVIEEEFDTALSRAVLGDEEAFSVMSASMNFLQSSGEINRLQQMTIQLGAMACQHDHLQSFSQSKNELFSDSFQTDSHADEHAGHDHESEDDDEDDDEEYGLFGKKKNKKRK